jgi:hypothetical protein
MGGTLCHQALPAHALIISSNQIVTLIIPLISHNVSVPALAVLNDGERYKYVSLTFPLFDFIIFCKIGYFSM